MAISNTGTPRKSPEPGLTADHLNWRHHLLICGLILSVALVDAIWLAVGPMSIDWSTSLPVLLFPLFFATIAVIYLIFRPAPRLAMGAVALAELFAFFIPGVTLSCLMTSLRQPMADDAIAAWDAALRLDWVAYVKFLNAHPPLFRLSGLLYLSSRYQVALLAIVLGICGQYHNLNRFIGNLILGAVIISVVGGLLPALGGYYHFGMLTLDEAHFGAITQAFHDGRETTIRLADVKGIITFPSYHAAMSMALILASGSLGYLRYPMVLINVGLIAGVPVHGAHYFVDVIAGIVIILAVDQVWLRLHRAPAVARQTSFAN
jgi:hypothetical protein